MQKNTRFAIKNAKTFKNTVLFGMVALLAVFSAVSAQLINFHNTSEPVNFFLSLITLTFTVLLWFFCANSFALDRREKRIFGGMVIIFFFTGLTLLLSAGSEKKPQTAWLAMLLSTLLYLLSAVYWLAFWLFQKGKYSHSFGKKVCGIIHLAFWGIYILLVIINHFTGFCFTIDADGDFAVHSPILFGMTIAWFVIYFLLAVTTQCNIKTKLTLASCSLFPLAGWLPILFHPDIAFYLDIFSSLGIFLYLIPLYLLFFNVYLESGRLYLQREKEMEQSRANAMMLKISPHFISNTMSSIVALCHTDAQKAGELAADFAVYLRDNYTDINENTMIPFATELEHIRNYLAIEEKRFPGLIVEYDVQTSAFLLPTLTVQPLVENAVRHGISKQPDASGTVKISSFENENNYFVRIADDGVGYRPEPKADNKRQHIGIANARTRLALICGGTLTVSALPKGGTVCEIIIPKGSGKA